MSTAEEKKAALEVGGAAPEESGRLEPKIIQKAPAPAVTETPIKSAATAEKKKILVVDDDATLLDIYTAVFREANFEVVVARDGLEAMQILQGVKKEAYLPDVVFTGINMPNMSGFELIGAMKKDARFAKIPVAISSHRGLQEHENAARDLGVKDFIVQGFTPPLEVVRRMRALTGLETKFNVKILPKKEDGKAFIQLLKTQQGESCPADIAEEAKIEIEAGQETGTFKIKLIC